MEAETSTASETSQNTDKITDTRKPAFGYYNTSCCEVGWRTSHIQFMVTASRGYRLLINGISPYATGYRRQALNQESLAKEMDSFVAQIKRTASSF